MREYGIRKQEKAYFKRNSVSHFYSTEHHLAFLHNIAKQKYNNAIGNSSYKQPHNRKTL